MTVEDQDGEGISPEAQELGKAMADYMEQTGRHFPSWSEVLEVAESLGYRRVAKKTELPKPTPRQCGKPGGPRRRSRG